MKVKLEYVCGSVLMGMQVSSDRWMLRYEFDLPQPETTEHDGKWIKYAVVCYPNQFDISKQTLAKIKELYGEF